MFKLCIVLCTLSIYIYIYIYGLGLDLRKHCTRSHSAHIFLNKKLQYYSVNVFLYINKKSHLLLLYLQHFSQTSVSVVIIIPVATPFRFQLDSLDFIVNSPSFAALHIKKQCRKANEMQSQRSKIVGVLSNCRPLRAVLIFSVFCGCPYRITALSFHQLFCFCCFLLAKKPSNFLRPNLCCLLQQFVVKFLAIFSAKGK